jgi:hypothetical protein
MAGAEPTASTHATTSGSYFFVAYEPAALAGLERTSAQCRVSGRVSTSVFFLKPPHAAGKSVASMSAVAFSQRAAVWIKGWRIMSLICRNPITPQLKACCYLGQLNFQLRIAIFVHNFKVWYWFRAYP